jgi:adenosylhomocysteine nucleosidase
MAYQSDFAGAAFGLGTLSRGDQVADLAAAQDHPRQDHSRTVIAFVGMAFEARIAAGPGVLVVCRSDEEQLAAMADSAVRQGYRGIISFGVAGGLADGLRPGDWVVASAVHESQSIRETDRAWSRKLVRAIKGAHYAPILGVDQPVANPTLKRELHRATGAAACDMESHVVSRLAETHGLAFAALRVIVDPAKRTVPRAALASMGPDGRTDIPALLRELVAQPSQITQLARLALDALAARTELQRVRTLLGPHFGLTDVAAAKSESRLLSGADQIEIAAEHQLQSSGAPSS